MADLTLEELMQLASTAALAGGAELKSHFGEVSRNSIQRKALGDYASKADLAAERAIAAILAKAGEHYVFVGEETGTRNVNAKYRWVVDPLDGTSNFILGHPLFCCQHRPLRRSRRSVGCRT